MNPRGAMRLRVMVPTHELVDRPIAKLIARGRDGAFCLLPRHVDFVSALTPGIMAATGIDGKEVFIATDEGLLVKTGADVLVSVTHAIEGSDIGRLREALDEQLGAIDDEERRARTALARLEANALRGFLDLERMGHV